jgi:hypothetical protein
LAGPPLGSCPERSKVCCIAQSLLLVRFRSGGGRSRSAGDPVARPGAGAP